MGCLLFGRKGKVSNCYLGEEAVLRKFIFRKRETWAYMRPSVKESKEGEKWEIRRPKKEGC